MQLKFKNEKLKKNVTKWKFYLNKNYIFNKCNNSIMLMKKFNRN